MTTSSDAVFLDTNVLVYAADESATHHIACRSLCSRGIGGSERLCLSPQILSEFISVATNPNVLPHPLSARDARLHAEMLAASFAIITGGEGLVPPFFGLLQSLEASGKRVHDILHAATMLENGIDRIYTYDAGFTRIPGITVITP
jgi:predicted nucleic acid-binding protein